MTDMLLDKISKKLFEYFVTNPSVIAMQMPDGKYIPQAINYDYNLFCQMLEKRLISSCLSAESILFPHKMDLSGF
ncbi:hypothetical protein MKN84_01225 [Streptococcus suis]|uniref:hypothetical protein n=1 Tax=Streptococcus parasuis TaxID=1501662 RepID=UPI002378E5B9|nr:hypothetical protein [Streptococcus parasuis]MDG3180366.1 hypothetical protein [Streptococcus suis]WDM37207.1 hypothetical protein KEM15_07970 [Streptococcus parasuis]